MRPAICPVIWYRDPRAALAWLETAFGFETTLLVDDGAGGVIHSEAVLAVKYREKGEHGMRGGPMYYLAKGAGLPCLITTSTYTVDEDFSEADRVVPELGDEPTINITLADLRELAAEHAAA